MGMLVNKMVGLQWGEVHWEASDANEGDIWVRAAPWVALLQRINRGQRYRRSSALGHGSVGGHAGAYGKQLRVLASNPVQAHAVVHPSAPSVVTSLLEMFGL